MYETNPFFYGTGRRKKSVARVGSMQAQVEITINRDIDEYFGLETLKVIVRQPLELTNTTDKFDIVCRVSGGGVTGQAGAIRHGIARALLEYRGVKARSQVRRFPHPRPENEGEKKYGLKGARRAPSSQRDSFQINRQSPLWRFLF